MLRPFQLYDLHSIWIECCVTLSMMTTLGSVITRANCLVLFVSILIFRKGLPRKTSQAPRCGMLYSPDLKASFELVVAKRLTDHRWFLVPGFIFGKPLEAYRQYQEPSFQFFILIVLYCVFLTCFQTTGEHVLRHTTEFRKTLRQFLFCSIALTHMENHPEWSHEC